MATRRYLAVNYWRKADGWVLQWANPTPKRLGHVFDPPLEGEGPFRTKREALARKREIVS